MPLWVWKTYMQKRLCVQSSYMQLWKWKILSKYYGLFSDYLWWSYRFIGWKNKICSIKFQWKKSNLQKTHSFYILLAFVLITIVLLIVISIYCYLIKYQAKDLLPFQDTNDKWNKFFVNIIIWKWVLKIYTLKTTDATFLLILLSI